MLRIIDILKPFPKNYVLTVEEKNTVAYFNYRKYVNINEMCQNLLALNNEKLFETLSIFSKKHYKYKDILYHNLQGLNIIKMNDNKEYAGYTHAANRLTYFYDEDVYHELIHVASSYIDYDNYIFYSGFNYHDLCSNKNFGEGIMEGYVELLCQRDTRDNKVIEKHSDEKKTWESSYFYVNALARQLEILIGQDEMEDMFFNNGFIRLKNWMLQYKDEKSVMKFFKNCDISVLAQDYNLQIFNRRVLEAQDFLFDICQEFFPEKIELLKYEKLIKNNKKLITQRIYNEQEELKQSKKTRR